METTIKKVIVVDSDSADARRTYDESIALFNQDGSPIDLNPTTPTVEVVIPLQPWLWSPTIGNELWALANFETGSGRNATDLSPSITCNSSGQSLKTTVALIPSNTVGMTSYRLSGTLTTPTPGGTWWITAEMTDNTSTLLSGSSLQYLFNSHSVDGDFIFEFQCQAEWSQVSSAFLTLNLVVQNNVASGDLVLSNITLKEIVNVSNYRPMQFTSGTGENSGVSVFNTHRDPVSDTWKVLKQVMTADGDLTYGLANVVGYPNDQPWRDHTPDPTFLSPDTNGWDGKLRGTEESPSTNGNRSLRITNNDQILEVMKTDTSFELRGNTHGGEVNDSGPVWEYLDSNEEWQQWASGSPAVVDSRIEARRFRVTWPTTISRSSPDSDVFATVNHITNYFPDGMTRTDRITTFTQDVTLRAIIDWMSSHSTSIQQVGRIGAGLTFIDEMDTYLHLAIPDAPTAGTTGSGGTLAAATYTYSVTALTEGGETLPSPMVSQAATGGSSIVTLTLPSTVTGQTGWNIYGRIAGVNRQVLLDSIPVSDTTWVDDGSIPSFGKQIPTKNTARRFDSSTPGVATISSSLANWSAWKDLPTGWVFGHILDRKGCLLRDEIDASKVTMQSVSGTRKQYFHLFNSSDFEVPVTSGTVWTSTHYSCAYLPTDLDGDWHFEIASKAEDTDVLALMYPAT